MPARKALLDGDIFSGDYLPGGSPTVPATARPTTPAAIAPSLFEPPPAAVPRVPVTSTPQTQPGSWTTYGTQSAATGSAVPRTPATTPINQYPATGGSTDRANAIAQFYRTALGRTDDQIQSDPGFWGWVNSSMDLGAVQQAIYASDEARNRSRQPAPTEQWARPGGTATGGSGGDARSALSAIYAKYGLDPNNPGYGLADVNYFLRRLNETDPNDLDYWAGDNKRLEQEIRKSLFGEVGNMIDTGGGSGAGSGFGFSSGYENNPALDALLQDALTKLVGLGGMSPSGSDVYGSLKKIIDAGGATPDITAQLVKARDNSVLAEQGMLADARGELADRGLLSEPGSPQGAEISAIRRISERIAPDFANALTDIQTHAMDTGRESLMSALQMATGMGQDAAHNLLQAVSVGTNRETALAGIALQTLSENRQWQQFLMQHGLDRDRLDNEIQQGNWQTVLQLVQSFLSAANVGGQGHI